MAVVLNDTHDHEGSHRTVLISGYFAHEISELDAKMYVDSCTLIRFTETEMPVRFHIGAADMDVLVEEWQKFKAARVAYMESEKQEEQAILNEALALAKEHGFTVHTSNDYYQPIWGNGSPFTRGYVSKWELLDSVRQMVTIQDSGNDNY